MLNPTFAFKASDEVVYLVPACKCQEPQLTMQDADETALFERAALSTSISRMHSFVQNSTYIYMSIYIYMCVYIHPNNRRTSVMSPP